MCKHARAHANIHDPDTDDSLYPLPNQLYMSEKKSEGESEEVQQLLVCKQTQSLTIISCSPSLAPFSFSHSLESSTCNAFSNLHPLKEQRCFHLAFTRFFPPSVHDLFVPSCTPLPSSPHFAPSISPHVNAGHFWCMSHDPNSTEFVSTAKSRESV